MRIAGLDVSKNRIGLAFSDSDCLFIAYETTIIIKGNKLFKQQLEKLFKEYKPEKTYVGLPFNDRGNSAKFIKFFMQSMRHIIPNFSFIDEDFSTIYSNYLVDEQIIKDFDSIDSIVAKSIVFNFLKSK